MPVAQSTGAGMRSQSCLDFFKGGVGDDAKDPQAWGLRYLLRSEDIDDEQAFGVQTIHPIGIECIEIAEAQGIDADCGQNSSCAAPEKI